MRTRELWVLSALTAAMVVLTVVAGQLRHQSSVEGVGELWLEEFDINAVSRIELAGAGNQTLLSLAQDSYQWRVEQRGNYPADLSLIRRLLLDLSEAKLLARKTANPDDHARLGLRDIAQEDARGYLLMLTMPDGIRSLRIGNQPEGRTATYVRVAEDPQTWIINRILSLSPDPAGWLAPELLNLADKDIALLRVMHPDGETVTGARVSGSDGLYLAEGLPVGMALKHEYALQRITSAVIELELEDVLSVEEAEGYRKESEVVRTEIEMVSGYVLVAELFSEGTDRYVRFSVKMPEDLSAKARADATALEQRLRDWVFRIPNFAYTSLTVRWADVAQPAPSGAEAY